MTSSLLHRAALLASSTIGLFGAGASSAAQVDPLAPLAPPPPASTSPYIGAGTIAPSDLQERIVNLGRAFDGKAGIAIVSLKDGWEIDWNATSLFPQQSCSKLWVAITALDEVDKGRIRLNDQVTLGRDDLTLFHQPLAAKILGGGHTTTLGALMFTAITESDNTWDPLESTCRHASLSIL